MNEWDNRDYTFIIFHNLINLRMSLFQDRPEVIKLEL